MAQYASLDELKKFVAGEDQRDINNDLLALNLEVASRAVDRYCGRPFSKATSATARMFRASTSATVRVDDLWTTTGLVVKTDDNDDGAAETTWTVTTDYIVEPLNGLVDGVEGFPYWSLRAVGSRSFPRLRRSAVEVTAQWGWAAVPPAVKQATLTLALATYKQKDAPLGIAGFSEFGSVRVPADIYRQVAALLEPYRRADRIGMVV